MPSSFNGPRTKTKFCAGQVGREIACPVLKFCIRIINMSL